MPATVNTTAKSSTATVTGITKPSAVDFGNEFLLMESGDFLLLESGDKIILEPNDLAAPSKASNATITTFSKS